MNRREFLVRAAALAAFPAVSSPLSEPITAGGLIPPAFAASLWNEALLSGYIGSIEVMRLTRSEPDTPEPKIRAENRIRIEPYYRRFDTRPVK